MERPPRGRNSKCCVIGNHNIGVQVFEIIAECCLCKGCHNGLVPWMPPVKFGVPYGYGTRSLVAVPSALTRMYRPEAGVPETWTPLRV